MDRSEYYRYLQSPQWAALKGKARERSGGNCERCRDGAHEITYRVTAGTFGHERPEDLMGLCEACHLFVLGSSDFDPAKQAVSDDPDEYYLIPLYVFSVPWIDGWNDTFLEANPEDGWVLNTALDAICDRELPSLKSYGTHFGCVPQSDYPGMCVWAGRSFNSLDRAELGIQKGPGGFVAAFEKFTWLSERSWLFFAKHYIWKEKIEVIDAENLSAQELRDAWQKTPSGPPE